VCGAHCTVQYLAAHRSIWEWQKRDSAGSRGTSRQREYRLLTCTPSACTCVCIHMLRPVFPLMPHTSTPLLGMLQVLGEMVEDAPGAWSSTSTVMKWLTKFPMDPLPGRWAAAHRVVSAVQHATPCLIFVGSARSFCLPCCQPSATYQVVSLIETNDQAALPTLVRSCTGV
jgi:hypothetical protein